MCAAENDKPRGFTPASNGSIGEFQVVDYLTSTDNEYLGFLSSTLSSQKVLVTSNLCFLWKTVEQFGKAFVIGPKGVGKTFSLLFLVCCYLTKAFVYISPGRNYSILNHLNKLGEQCQTEDIKTKVTIPEKLASLSREMKDNLLILIDIADTKDEYLQLVHRIMVDCHNSKIAIATSSGFGHYLNNRIWQSIMSYSQGGYKRCRLLNFGEEEVLQFIKGTKVEAVHLETIKRLTYYNPYLLNLLCLNGIGLESDYYDMSDTYLINHVHAVVSDIQKYSGGLPRFCMNMFEQFYDWGCKADIGRSNSLKTLSVFRKSWGAKEHILYYKVFPKNETFIVMCALPCLHMLLKEIAETIYNSKTIPDVPIVHGFVYELHYVNQMKLHKTMSVKGHSESKIVNIKEVCEVDVIAELLLGTLYHLKYTYPVIDAVGYLEVDGVPSLVFVQVSLSQYSSHSTKINDLTTTKAPENKRKSILKYCQDMIKSTQRRKKKSPELLYVYVTPPELTSPSNKKRKTDVSSIRYFQWDFDYPRHSHQ